MKHPQRDVLMSKVEYNIARERGRSMAAQALLLNPEKRLEMESRFGVERCRIQYPEAYGLTTQPRIVLP